MSQNNSVQFDKEQQRQGRMLFLLLIIFFIVPIVVVVMMYQFNWKPSGESLGELIRPPRALQTPSNLLNNDAKILPPLLWKEKWSMVYIADDCADICMAKLIDMRRLHVSLYKDIARVQRILITKKTEVETIKQNFPDLIIINQPEESVAKITAQFQIKSEDPALSNRFYLVDPLGFLMMSYAADMPLANVRKDVARLLKYSWAG